MAYFALDDFIFEFKDKQLTNFTQSLKFSFSKIERIGNNPAYFNTGGFEESVSLELELLMQRQDTLKEFLAKVKEKKPFFMVLGYGEIIGEVLVQNINVKHSSITPFGESLKQSLTLELLRYYQ